MGKVLGIILQKLIQGMMMAFNYYEKGHFESKYNIGDTVKIKRYCPLRNGGKKFKIIGKQGAYYKLQGKDSLLARVPEKYFILNKKRTNKF